MTIAAVLAGALGLSAAGCQGAGPATLPDAGPGHAGTPSPARTRAVPPAPAPDDARPAVPDVDPARTVSPAQGPVRLVVRAAPPAPGPALAAYQAYLGWVRGYLTAFARPGRDGGVLDRYATPAVAAAVRRQAAALVTRGWAEYGTATVVTAAARVAGSAATVQACLDLSGLATRDAHGRLAGRDQPVRSVATLTASAGGWQVRTDAKTPVAGCS